MSQGIRLFETVTGLTVYDLLHDNQVRTDGQINYRDTAGPQIVEQHAIRIEAGELVVLGNTAAQVTEWIAKIACISLVMANPVTPDDKAKIAVTAVKS